MRGLKMGDFPGEIPGIPGNPRGEISGIFGNFGNFGNFDPQKTALFADSAL